MDKDPIYDTVFAAVRDALRAESFDIQRALQQDALRETVEFVKRNLPLHLGCATRLELIDRVIDQAPPKGLVLEFGVYKGTSLNLIARRLPDRTVHGFDSFEGAPEPWLYRSRAFTDVDGLPAVEDNCVLVKGWFADTLPRFLEEFGGDCALVHIDSDLYSSAATIFEHLAPHLASGTIILFDEFFNYPGWSQGEYRAFNEFTARTGATFEYVGFTYQGAPEERRRREGGSGYQVAVRIESNPAYGGHPAARLVEALVAAPCGAD